MKIRINESNIENKRMLNEMQARQYTGLGRTMCRNYCERIGAVKHIGRRILYDKRVIDEFFDELGEGGVSTDE